MLLGCRPKGRFIEQHDIFFGIASTLKELVPHINSFWPETLGKFHIDVWRHVMVVGDYKIDIVPKGTADNHGQNLYFINLGGYKKEEFDEFHYKVLVVSETLEQAVIKAKETAFYKHNGFSGAVSHIDEKFGIDVDDFMTVDAMLMADFTIKYDIQITRSSIVLQDDKFHIGYLKPEKIDKQ